MNEKTSEQAQFLRSLYLEKKAKNQAYSLRAFARDLHVSHTLLSLVMSGKRPLSLKQAARMGVALGLSAEEHNALIQQVVGPQTKGRSAKRTRKNKPVFWNVEIEKFKTISEWHHLAILDLSMTKGFQENPNWIAKRLGIPSIQARDAVERLERMGLLVRKDEKLTKKENFYAFQNGSSKAALRLYLSGLLKKADEHLKSKTTPDDSANRWMGGGTLTIKKSQIAAARAKLQKIQDDFIREAAMNSGSDAEEVFQFSIQFFPLTDLSQPKTKGAIQ